MIDSGKVKMKLVLFVLFLDEFFRHFTVENRIDVLKVQSISKAQAQQRAGRAGREAPGICYRLVRLMEDFNKYSIQTLPGEIF